MPAQSDPWINISPSEVADMDNLRRVASTHPLEFWWGRDHKGRALLVLDIPAPSTTPKYPELAGVEISSTQVGNGVNRLVLTLLDQDDRDIFLALCNDLLDATDALPRDAGKEGLRVVLVRLARWQDLFRRRRDKLTLNEIIGLVGELLFMRDCLLTRISPAAAIAMWRGPYGDEQDFIVGATILEVKTQLATADHAILVSSEHQLDTAAAPIAVVHQILGPALPTSNQAVSLNQLVSELRNEMSTKDPSALEPFDGALATINYVAIPAYDEPIWLLAGREIFRVAELFPRIVPAAIPVGIEKVRYHVRLEACAPFRAPEEEFMREIVGA